MRLARTLPPGVANPNRFEPGAFLAPAPSTRHKGKTEPSWRWHRRVNPDMLLLMPAYALTIFIGAFLLFQVQPLMGKYILPWFGGGPGVWTTCMLFFQVLLLGGYAYAHFTTQWLKPRKQALLHLVLLAAALALAQALPQDRMRTGMAEVGRTGSRGRNGTLSPITPRKRSGRRSAACQATGAPQS